MYDGYLMKAVRLTPMTHAEFEEFLPQAIETYAQENVVAGRWLQAGALARSRADFMALLPDGAATAGHTLLCIRSGNQRVGSLWYAVDTTSSTPQVHVYDLHIDAAQRRKGFATAAFREMEHQLRAAGVTRVGLHVFGHNIAARALYVRLGYAVTSINMLKSLD